MALPPTVRVKLSSEAAGSISLTPVVAQELPVRDLIEHILSVTGKDEARIRELLRRGTLVSGASRFRWAGWEADAEGLSQMLATFPDADPARPFAADLCVRAILRGTRQSVEITREMGMRRGLFQRGTFWDLLMEVATAAPAAYAGYSYRDRADHYVREFAPAEIARIRAASDAVKFSTLRERIRSAGFAVAELHATR